MTEIKKIKTIRIKDRPNILWVELVTAEGIVGLGETWRGASAVEGVIHDDIAPWLLGRDSRAIERISNVLLNPYVGFHSASAEVREENFPTRVYGDLTLAEGVYDALIIELGTGTGDNWWCVLYPPLCFTSSSQDVEYRSIILDIISDFFD